MTADGQALTKGSVRFQPDSAKGNSSKFEPAGEIASDGTYTLSTYGKPGAPAGAYKVSVTSGEAPDSTNPKAAKSYVAAKYNDPVKSGVTVDVVETPVAGAYDLKLSAK